MAGSNYTVIVNAVVQQPQIQNQLNKMNLTIKAPTMTNADKIENQIIRWNNQFSLMQTKSEKAFSMPSVQKEYTQYQKMVDLYRQGLVTRDDMITQINNTTTAYGKEAYAINTVNKAGMNYTEMLALAIKKIAIWMIGTQAIYGSLQQVREGIQYITNLNKEMTNIQIVSGMTSKAVQQLALDYNDLARQLSVTTLEVAKGSLEWIRQGKTAEETSQLLRASVMMGTLANIEQAQSTEYLTSIINGYKLSMDEVMPTIDKLVVLDNNYATSVAEIAEAMQRSSNIARLSGVSLEQLASMITVISSVTRKSADSIGESLKTIMTRMQNVKLGKTIDEEGEAISDVEKVLAKFDIRLRDETTLQFRNMGVVLEEVMKKWKELGAAGKTVEQSMIAVAFAGVRQAENFKSLMDNSDKYTEALKLTGTALGTTEQRYKTYTDSVEAHANRFKVAVEAMWQKTLSPETLKGISDLGTVFIKLIDDMGGLIPILGLLINSLFFLKSAAIGDIIIKIVKAFDALGEVVVNAILNLKTLNSTLLATKIAALSTGQALSLALGAMGLVFFGIYEAVQQVNTEMQHTYETLSKMKTETDDSINELQSLSNEYKNLSEKENKSTEDKTRLLDIQSILNTKYNEGGKSIDIYSSAIDNNTGAIQENIRWMKERVKVEAQTFVDANKQTYEETKKKIALPEKRPGGAYGTSVERYTPEEKDAMQQIIIDYEHYLNVLKELKGEYNDWVSSADHIKEVDQAVVQEIKDYKELEKTLSSLGDKVKSIIGDFEKYGQISLSQVDELRTAFGDDYVKVLYVEGNQIKINTDALKQLLAQKALDVIKTIEQTIASRQHAGAMQEEIDALILEKNIAQAYYNQIVDGSLFAADATKALADAQKQQQEAQQKLLQMTISMIKQETQTEIDGLKDKLDHYKAIIDVRKKLLDQQKSEKDYQDTIKDKNKEISDIDNQLLALQFDNSEAAKAKRLQLEADKANKIEELNKTQYDHSIETQKDALDTDYDKYAENINKKIKKLEEYLRQEGTITQDALNLIESRSEAFYQRLMNWNMMYGDGLRATVENAWNGVTEATKRATEEVRNYANAFQAAISSIAGAGIGGIIGLGEGFDFGGGNLPTYGDWSGDNWIESPYPIPPINTNTGGDTGTIPGRPGGTYHSGGFVGGLPQLQASEEYGKLLKGEFVSTPNMMSNFINNTLPNLVASVSGNGDTNIELAVNVQGNMDKTVLPQLKEAVLASITTAMQQRGKLRNVNSYSV